MANIRLFEHSSISGRQLFIAHATEARYLLADGEYLDYFEFNDITSSVRLSATPGEPQQTCFLFEEGRFDGRFKAFAFRENRDIISLPYFNDLTSSVILVSHTSFKDNILLSLRETAGEQINLAIDKHLSAYPGFSRNGDVLLNFTIDNFEIGQFGNDLVGMEIPLLCNGRSRGIKSSATLNLYIDLFINGNNRLNAAIVGWRYAIEPGRQAEYIENNLIHYSPGLINSIETSLDNVMHEINFRQWRDIYLMPGRTDRIDIDYDGTTRDDCTLVLVPEPEK